VWQKIVEIAKQIVSLTSDAKKSKEDIKALQEENKELRRENAELRQEVNEQRVRFVEVTRYTERMMYELQRTRDNAEADKRLLRVEMENLLLRSGRVLPPAETAPDEPNS